MTDNAKAAVGFFFILVVLPLSILGLRDCIRRASAMNYSKAQIAGRVSAYILGVSFVIIGVLGFLNNLEQDQASSHLIASPVFGVAITICGLLTWTATWFRYGGGFWSIVGAFLIAGALTGTVSIAGTHMRGWHFDSPASFDIRIASFWLMGSVFLVLGHRRHNRKNRDERPVV